MLHLPGGFPPISNRGVATDSVDNHNAYHMIYRYVPGLGGDTEVVYGSSAEEAMAALYERSVKWDDLRIVHQDLCWCQHAR